MESILQTVKKQLGITEEYTHFDPELILHINSVFTILNQLGIGPVRGFSIKDASAVWTDFIPEDSNLELVKTYVAGKVRLLFDPPSGSAVLNALTQTIAEFEWRLQVQAESLSDGASGFSSSASSLADSTG